MGNTSGKTISSPESGDWFPLLQLLPLDVLLKLSSYLPTSSLLALMLTCHQSKTAIEMYVRHQVLAKDRLSTLRAFLSNGPLLLPEVALRRKLCNLGSNMEHSIIYLKAVRQLCRLRRVKVSDATTFPHLGDSRYIHMAEDFELQRSVVSLHMVCWLNFVVDFDQVHKGRYEASLRLRLSRRLNWPSYPFLVNNPANLAVLSVTAVDEDDDTNAARGSSASKVMVSESFKPTWWKEMRDRKFKAEQHLKHASIRFEGSTGWMWIVLEPFDLEKNNNRLSFEFRDIDNPHWKSGMDWDFVQLKQLR